MRDFLNGLDNLHEHMRTSYPKMRTPSFFVEHETKNGLVIHYRSKRKGYIYYMIGQIKQVRFCEFLGFKVKSFGEGFLALAFFYIFVELETKNQLGKTSTDVERTPYLGPV